ncbi:GntR family transcriptional regulator [Algihabitans albus]|uniref:GntR family transcriptional regulator n=1 Tax=Algihabitans albus TaxID=2164067 RepID=UPI000E5D7F98|nr:GntR family transcriptional regulator [Algihabitans albus]
MDDLSLSAYRQIRRLIEGGTFDMGVRVREARLARQLGLSRTPIRAALNRLELEGLLVYEPNRGHIMATYSEDDVSEIYVCRSILESEAVRIAAERGLEPPTEASLVRLAQEMDETIGAQGLSQDTKRSDFLALNKQFHETIYAHCANRHLLELIDRTSGLPLIIRNYFGFSDDELFRSQADHRALLHALQSRQADRARALMKEHILVACERMLHQTRPARAAE